MLTAIAASAISALAGVAIGASVSSGRGLRSRVTLLERNLAIVTERALGAVPELVARQDALEQVMPELITRQEVSSAFAKLAAIEEQRAAARQAAATAPMPSMEVPPRPTAMSAQELNAAMTQQLAALNERLQQVTGQRMPG